MFSIIRRVVPVLAVVGGVVAIPGVASADQTPPAAFHNRSERDRFEHQRLEHERIERERAERERIERERIARVERERREHENVCASAVRHGASHWRLRELGCYVR